MKPTLPFAQYDKDVDHLHILHKDIPDGVTNLYSEDFVRQQQAEIEALKGGFFDWSGYANTLTDEEIGNIANEVFGEFNWSKRVLTFARAILRKAQEK